MAKIRCDECGRLVDADEETGEPVDHACVDYDPDTESLQELDFND